MNTVVDLEGASASLRQNEVKFQSISDSRNPEIPLLNTEARKKPKYGALFQGVGTLFLTGSSWAIGAITGPYVFGFLSYVPSGRSSCSAGAVNASISCIKNTPTPNDAITCLNGTLGELSAALNCLDDSSTTKISFDQLPITCLATATLLIGAVCIGVGCRRRNAR